MTGMLVTQPLHQHSAPQPSPPKLALAVGQLLGPVLVSANVPLATVALNPPQHDE